MINRRVWSSGVLLDIGVPPWRLLLQLAHALQITETGEDKPLWIERGGRAVAFSACVSDQPDSRLIQTEEMDAPAAVLVCLNPVEEPHMAPFGKNGANTGTVTQDDEPVGSRRGGN